MDQINQNLIFEKIDTIARCIQRVKDKKPSTLDELTQDIDRQDIISLNLERAVQAAVDIAAHVIAYTKLPASPSMALSFEVLEKGGWLDTKLAERMRKAVGLRNILVHQYQTVDWKIIWSVLEQHLDDFLDYCQVIRQKI